MSYDTKCWELAEYFLEDQKRVTDKVKTKLAQTIHDAIEDFLEDEDNFHHSEPPFDTRRERDEWRESQWDDANIREDARESA